MNNYLCTNRKPGSENYIPKTSRSLTGEEQSPVGEYADNANNEKSENQDTTFTTIAEDPKIRVVKNLF